MTTATIILVVVCLVWLWSLVDSVRRKNMPPMFGSARLASVVWLIALLLLAPLALVLYLLFVPFGCLARAPRLRTSIVVVALLACAWFQYGMTGVSDRDWRDDSPTWMSVNASVSYSTDSSWNKSHRWNQHAPFALDHLRIVHGPSPLGTVAAREIARRIDAAGLARTIECWPADRRSAPGARAPDYYIYLFADRLLDVRIPWLHRISGPVTLVGTATPGACMAADEGVATETAGLSIEAAYQIVIKRYGFAMGGAVYGDPGRTLGARIANMVVNQLLIARSEGGVLPAIPAAFAFTPTDPPAPLAGLELQPLDDECAAFVHSRRTWLWDHSGSAQSAFTEIRTAFESAGWRRVSPQRSAADELLFGRGVDRVGLRVWPPLAREISLSIDFAPLDEGENGEPGELLICHERRFDAAEMAAVRDRVCQPGAELGVWRTFLPSLDPKGRAQLRDVLRDAQSGRAGHWRLLSELHSELGDAADARDAIVVAQTLARVTVVSKDEKARVQSAAERLEVPEPESIDVSLLERAGFQRLQRDRDAVAEIEFGDTGRFVREHEGSEPTLVWVDLRGEASALSLVCRVTCAGTTSTSWRTETERVDGRVRFGGSLSDIRSGWFTVEVEPVNGRYRIHLSGQ